MQALFAEQSNIIDFPQQVKSNEWFTPSRYIEAARAVMGGIDLDPASCALANETVKATRYFTKEDDGLSKAWYGNVWLNPPYGRTAKMKGMRLSTIRLFTDKLIESYKSGQVNQAIILATTEVNAKWFYPLWQFPICFPNHRVHFHVPFETLQKYSQMFGSCFVYLGPHEQKFIEVFSQFGRIAKAIDSPRREVAQPSLWEVR